MSTDALTPAIGALYQARTEYEAAKRRKERCERDVLALLGDAGLKRTEVADLHLTVTAATRRTAKLTNQRMCEEALCEIGLVLPIKESVDTTELLAIADRYGGDFPGVTINETTSLTVRGMQR